MTVATAAEAGIPVVVIAVTDGELAGPQPNLAEVRRAELTSALAHLCGSSPVSVHFLERPDGGVIAHIDEVQLVIGE